MTLFARLTFSHYLTFHRHLKHEKRCCLAELECNLVVMKRSQPKVLRLNLVGPQRLAPQAALPFYFEQRASLECKNNQNKELESIRGPYVTPASSPEHESSLTSTDVGTSSISSSDPGASPFLLSELYENLKKDHSVVTDESKSLFDSDSDTDTESAVSSSTRSCILPWMADSFNSNDESKYLIKSSQRQGGQTLTSAYDFLFEKLSGMRREPEVRVLNYKVDLNLSKSVREAISLSRHAPSGPPPLCSICQHKAPVFGKPPKWFSYAELEHATHGFSQKNFLAEGGFGSVHKGTLADGRVIAVKQHKLASSQGDLEFCSEVEVLSCAQHRNVVMLIGFCIEDGKRLLVYEFICNGSLDSHLYGMI